MDAFQRWRHIPETMFDVELYEEEKVKFDGLLSSIRKKRDQTPTHKALSHGELLVFNKSGHQKPIFWCFNNWAEPYLLAHQLTNDRPLIAVNSLLHYEKLWNKKARYTEPLAKRYLDSALQLFSGHDFLIGGNCQGAVIAESISIQLAQRFRIYPQLITIDYISKRRYQGHMLLLFGSESPFNPFRYQVDPNSYWQERLKSFRWEFLNASHGSYFREPTIIRLKELILGFG